MSAVLGFGLPSEASAAALLIYQSDPPYYDYLFGSSQAAQLQLACLWQMPQGGLSHKRVQVWRKADQIIALAAHFLCQHDAQLSAEDQQAIAQLDIDLPALLQRQTDLDYLFPPLPDQGYYLRTLAVCAQFRGQHVGEQVLNEIMAIARYQGAVQLYTDVDSGNPGAVRFYQRTGFSVEQESRVPQLEAFNLPTSFRMFKALI